MKYLSKINKNKISFSSIFSNKIFILIVLLSISILNYKTANAGVFSFFSDMVSEKASAKTINEINSTNTNSKDILVLHAAVNTDPNIGKRLNDEPIILGNAFVAEIGPAGTVSDIENDNTNTQISLYTVHEGDTLSDIANIFKVNVNTILLANDLNKNVVLKKDQKLIILPISGLKYTVKKGDTIKGIVSRFKTDLNEVLLYNDLTVSSTLKAGDIIIIPDAEPVLTDGLRSVNTSKVFNNNAHDTDGPFYPGYYIKPINSGYKSQEIHGYNAVDLAAPIGTPIRSSAAGTVIASVTGGWNSGYGNYVIISHSNGTQTLYAHTSKNFVDVGDIVAQGQLIARIGITGRTTGPHVHFEIRGAKNPF